MVDSTQSTQKHIARVQELLGDFAERIRERGRLHDASKFSPEERGPLDEMAKLIEREGNAPFGSDEYKRRTELLGPMLKHHYENNSHHPEHYTDGVSGMDLLDLVEMFFDWKAASERGEESAMNVTAACARFNIDPMLASIFRNTADRLGFKHT